MKRTRKWAFVAQDAVRLTALGLPPREIAKRLGVTKSSVTRWIASGKLTRPGQTPKAPRPKVPRVRASKTPSQWSSEIRTSYDLDATDDQLVTIAESALAIALDVSQPTAARMNAAGRFQALVRQLSLVTKAADQPKGGETGQQAPKPVEPVAIVRQMRVDPRNILMAVK